MLTLTDDKLLKFVLILGKSCVVFVWGEKLGWPRTLFIILLLFNSFCSNGHTLGFPPQNRVTWCDYKSDVIYATGKNFAVHPNNI